MAPLSSLHGNKIRKEKEKGAYLQAPTSATTLKLLLLSHSYYHHVDIPEAPSLRSYCGFCTLEALIYSSSL